MKQVGEYDGFCPYCGAMRKLRVFDVDMEREMILVTCDSCNKIYFYRVSDYVRLVKKGVSE